MHSNTRYTQAGGHTGTRKEKRGIIKAGVRGWVTGVESFFGSGGDDDLCNDKDLNNRWGQVKKSGSRGSVNIEGNFLF